MASFLSVEGNISGYLCLLGFYLLAGYTVVCFLADVGQEEDFADPRAAPTESLKFSIHFEKGIPVKLGVGSETTTGSLELFKAVGKIGPDYGVSRVGIVESRFIGLVSLLLTAPLDLSSFVWLVLTSVSPLAAPSASSVISPSRASGPGVCTTACTLASREFLENSITFSQKGVNGKVNIMAYKGNTYAIGHSETKTSMAGPINSLDLVPCARHTYLAKPCCLKLHPDLGELNIAGIFSREIRQDGQYAPTLVDSNHMIFFVDNFSYVVRESQPAGNALAETELVTSMLADCVRHPRVAGGKRLSGWL
ncbi:hypothetical protein F5X98DRAFT_385253 [Xylaria grammica]|nr:hypothetical protein F5X98DRAFT_385253 [Xylaria grammica]